MNHQTSSNDHLSPLYFLDLQAERSKLATQSEIAHGALAALALEKRSMKTVAYCNLINTCTFYNVNNMYHHFSHFCLPPSLFGDFMYTWLVAGACVEILASLL